MEDIEVEVKDLNYIPDYIKYEENRQINEMQRQTNESERISNETEREGQEEIRQRKELERQENEEFRKIAEIERAETIESEVENLKAVEKDIQDKLDSGYFIGEQGIQGIQGVKGDTGNGIENIEKTSTNGLIDTYTITYTNNSTTTFNVTNGKEYDDTGVIQNITNIQEEQTEQNNKIEENTTNIENNRVEITELQEENNMLKSQFSTATAEGESIILNDSSDLKFKQFKISGNSKQETRSGKNVFNCNGSYAHHTSYNNTIATTETGKIITCHADSEDYTSTGNQWYGYAVMDLSNYVGSTVRMKCECESSSSLAEVGYYIGLCASDGTNRNGGSTKFTSSNNVCSFVVPELTEGQEYLSVWLFNNRGGTVSQGDTAEFKNIIITIDNEDMTYEAYGAMPSVDFPSEIETVKDVNETICNKNLLDIHADTIKGHYYGDMTITDDEIFFKSTELQWNTVNRRAWVIELPDLTKDIYISTESIIRPYSMNAGLWYMFTDELLTVLPNDNTDFTNISVSANGKSVKLTPNAKYLVVMLSAQYIESSSATGLTEDRTVTINKLMISYSDNTDYARHENQTYTMPCQQEILEGDYFDLETEEEVHIWKKIESYNNEEITTEYKSTTGELSEGATVYYKLEQEERLTLTEEQKAVAKQMKKAHTYKNVTHIYSTDEISTNVSVKYYQDNETLTNNKVQALQEQIDNLTEAVVALGGVE